MAQFCSVTAWKRGLSRPGGQGSNLATRAAIYRSLRPLRARNRKKVSTRVFWGGLEKSLEKYPKKSKNIDFRTFLGIFSGIFRPFRVFFETFLQTPQKTLFEPFLRFRARRARRLLKWRLGWPGVKSLCAVCGIQGTLAFSSGCPGGRIGDRGDREIVYKPFSGPYKSGTHKRGIHE